MRTSDSSTLAILALTYIGVAAGGVPGLRLDRAGIAYNKTTLLPLGLGAGGG